MFWSGFLFIRARKAKTNQLCFQLLPALCSPLCGEWFCSPPSGTITVHYRFNQPPRRVQSPACEDHHPGPEERVPRRGTWIGAGRSGWLCPRLCRRAQIRRWGENVPFWCVKRWISSDYCSQVKNLTPGRFRAVKHFLTFKSTLMTSFDFHQLMEHFVHLLETLELNRVISSG